MIRGFTLLVLCQIVGQRIAVATGLPLPGPVAGLFLLTAVLLVVGSGRSAFAIAEHNANESTSTTISAAKCCSEDFTDSRTLFSRPNIVHIDEWSLVAQYESVSVSAIFVQQG